MTGDLSRLSNITLQSGPESESFFDRGISPRGRSTDELYLRAMSCILLQERRKH